MSRSRALLVALSVMLASATATSTVSVARADVLPGPFCPELPCSINRNCSSTGMACKPDDRTCTEEARSKDLEVKCEQQCSDARRLIYCPPDTGRSDSKIVWVLLSMAVVLAVGGSTLLWIVLRKKSV